MEQGKICTKCGEWKEYKDFHKDKNKKDGHNVWCKRCIYPLKTKPLLKTDEGQECSLCNEFKGYDEFFFRKDTGKHRRDCKECFAKRRNKYYQENFETIQEQKKIYVQTEKGMLIHKEAKRKYKKTEKGKRSEKRYRKSEIGKATFFKNQKRYYQSELGKKRKQEQGQRHRQKYLEEIRERDRNRPNNYERNLKRRSYKNHVEFTPLKRKQILDRDKWKCQSCGIKVHDRSTGNWNTPDKAHIDHIVPISKGGHSEPSNLQALCRTCNLSKRDKVEQQLSLF